MKHSALVVLALAFTVLLATTAWAAPQESPAAAAAPTPASKPAAPRVPNYVLGPDDVIAIKALNAEEIENPSVRIDPRGHPDWPEWMTKVDFAGLKQKLLASIVAISAIQVLKAFMNIDATFDAQKLAWLAGIHLVFVVSTLLIVWSDKLGAHGNGGKSDH